MHTGDHCCTLVAIAVQCFGHTGDNCHPVHTGGHCCTAMNWPDHHLAQSPTANLAEENIIWPQISIHSNLIYDSTIQLLSQT